VIGLIVARSVPYGFLSSLHVHLGVIETVARRIVRAAALFPIATPVLNATGAAVSQAAPQARAAMHSQWHSIIINYYCAVLIIIAALALIIMHSQWHSMLRCCD
jgi:hypothetical protein